MDPRVRAVIALMTNNLNATCRSLKLRTQSISAHRIYASFSSETSVPIARYGRQLRSAEARELLRTTFLSVKEVAARVGVTGMSHFVRDFKKAYGSTPGRYVSRYRKAN